MNPDTKDSRQEGSVSVELKEAVATVKFGHPKSNSLPGTLLRRMAD